jgi:hypothetical protein
MPWLHYYRGTGFQPVMPWHHFYRGTGFQPVIPHGSSLRARSCGERKYRRALQAAAPEAANAASQRLHMHNCA